MEIITVGKKEEGKEYGFRETCFAIVVKDDNLYCTIKGGDISLIGGGVEVGENHEECLRREALEEAGCTIKNIEKLCTIDCFWKTRTNVDREALSHIYIAEIEDEIQEPTEDGSELKIIKLSEAQDLLPLPYHKRAIEEYLNSHK